MFGIARSFEVDFLALYGWTGLFAAFWTLLVAVFNLSWLVRYLTPFTEETFGMFISASFVFSTVVSLVTVFNRWYFDAATQAVPILYLGLCLLTPWAGLALRQVRSSTLFSARLREVISDFALPAAVLFASFFGSYVFRNVPLIPFGYSSGRVFVPVDFLSVPGFAIGAAAGFGLILMVLAVVDHNVSSATAQNPRMKLTKGTAYHYDLVVLAAIMVVSSWFGMPFLTAAVPFSADHVLSLADRHPVIVDGHVSFHVTYARENRVTALVANAVIGLCILLLPYPLRYVPVPVLYGVFLFMAATALDGNSFFERFSLFFMQPSLYPSRGYVRKVPRRTMHQFTAIQMFCWACLCVIAFVPSDFANLMFPVVLSLLVVVRQIVLPCFFAAPALHALDG